MPLSEPGVCRPAPAPLVSCAVSRPHVVGDKLKTYGSSAWRQVDIGGVPVRVGGIAKGSGMIHPNMATMLSVVTCDAAVDVGLWRALFKRAAVKSFNQVPAL